MNKNFGLLLVILGMGITANGFASFWFFQIILGAVTTFVGSQIYTREKGKDLLKGTSATAKNKFELTDEMIIRLAMTRTNNKLSIEQLTNQTSLTTEQAKQRLEQMHQKGLCQINLDEIETSGKIYYYFG